MALNPFLAETRRTPEGGTRDSAQGLPPRWQISRLFHCYCIAARDRPFGRGHGAAGALRGCAELPQSVGFLRAEATG